MFSSIEERRLGLVDPASFVSSQIMQRVLGMQMSRCEVESAHFAGVNCMDLENVEQRYLLSGSGKGTLVIHDLHDSFGDVNNILKAVCRVGRNSRYRHDFSVESVQWYPFDTGMFTSSGMDKKLKIWDSVTMKPADTFNMEKKIYCHHMSPVSTNACVAVAMGYPHVVLVDMKSGSRCHELRGHKGQVMCVQWSPSAEHLLASSGVDNKILLWDVRSAKSFLCSLDQHNGESASSKDDAVTAHDGLVNSLRFSPDGLYLLSFGQDHQIRLWDVAFGKNTLVNYGHLFNDCPKSFRMDICYCGDLPLAFVPSNTKVAVYELFTGVQWNRLLGHFGRVRSVVFRSFLQEIYTGGLDQKILLWATDILAPMEQAKMAENWSD